jgi:flagellar basal-body rod protein FlgF
MAYIHGMKCEKECKTFGICIMDTTIYVGLSHQMALRRHMDVIAGNIANANSAGFQRENMQFEKYIDRMEDAPLRTAKPVAFVLDYGVTRDATPGELVQTGNGLDAALIGEGFFTIQSLGGEVMYTRNGRFSPDADGYLVTSQGAKLLDTAGKAVRIESNDSDVRISPDGSVQAKDRQIANLAIVRFSNPNSLERAGDSQMRATAASLPDVISNPKLKSGMLEQSNVKPIVEMTEMIAVQRNYEATSKMMQNYEDIRKRSIERLARVQ